MVINWSLITNHWDNSCAIDTNFRYVMRDNSIHSLANKWNITVILFWSFVVTFSVSLAKGPWWLTVALTYTSDCFRPGIQTKTQLQAEQQVFHTICFIVASSSSLVSCCLPSMSTQRSKSWFCLRTSWILALFSGGSSAAWLCTMIAWYIELRQQCRDLP